MKYKRPSCKEEEWHKTGTICVKKINRKKENSDKLFNL